ncbi:MAG: NAD(P)H-hydrate dehydratase, partial [Kiritimatiellaeota bacterium]|nr:NAD(P)H-hydrate dehydratase [Kiritimatiellota bacterium]
KWCGCVYVNDLGRARSLNAPYPPDEMVTEGDVEALIPPRRWDAHKGDFGHVVVVGGAVGYSGAAVIAARGAMDAGAGLVSVLMAARRDGFAPPIPAEVMVRTCFFNNEKNERNETDENVSIFSLFSLLENKTLVVGPGWGRFEGAAEVVMRLANESGARAIVIDADGLNAFEGKAEKLKEIKVPCIITPHPGEAKRLLGMKCADRSGDLLQLVELTGAAVILKGAGTLVSAPGEGVHLIPFANPRMARGGTGDLLAGMCGAWLARGLSAFDAARVAAWKHADQLSINNYQL